MQALELLARQVQPPLHGGRVTRRPVYDQCLTDARHGAQGDLAQTARLHRHIAPPQHIEVMRGETPLQRRLGPRIAFGDEDHRHAERLPVGQRNARRLKEQLARHRRHHAYAVAALAVGGDGSAMRQATERGQRLRQDAVRGDGLHRRDEAHAARVMVETGVNERRASEERAGDVGVHSSLYVAGGKLLPTTFQGMINNIAGSSAYAYLYMILYFYASSV